MFHTITPKEAVELFLLDVQSSGRSRETTTFYRRQLTPFLGWLAASDNPPAHLHELTADHFRRYLLRRTASGVKPRTVHAAARSLRAFCNFCTRDGLWEVSPFASVTMPRLPRPLPRALSDKELRQLVSSCTLERDKAIVLFLADSGVRAFELCALTVGDVDMATGAVTVQAGKGQKGRVTYVGARTRKQLGRYYVRERGGVPAGHEPVFLVQGTTRPMTYWAISSLMQRLSERTGVHATAHMFRRTFAINCLRNGMNVYVLARMMGHSTIDVLKHYLAVADDDVRDAHGRAGPVDHMSTRP